jgi:hypothetical protein
MFRGILKRASHWVRYMPRRVVLLTGVSALALLTYCGVQKGENLNSAVELPPPTTIPWDEPAGKAEEGI